MKALILFFILAVIFTFAVDVSTDINMIMEEYTGKERDTVWEHMFKEDWKKDGKVHDTTHWVQPLAEDLPTEERDHHQ